MTIITHQWSDPKKSNTNGASKSEIKPMVDSAINYNKDISKDVEASKNPSLIVTWEKTKARRANSMATIFVSLIGILVIGAGLFGSIYLYHQFNRVQTRYLRGWVSVPLSSENAPTPRAENLKTHGLQWPSFMASKINQIFSNPDKYFDIEYDIDLEAEHFTRIEVPQSLFFRRGRFIHDFVANKTGILDMEEKRCFFMPLNRSLILPPRPFLDVILKFQSDMKDVDLKVVRHYYRIQGPPISDYKNVGYYISRECSDMPTYLLQMISSPIFKRSTDRDNNDALFAEFTGSKIHEIDISNAGITKRA